MNPRLTAKDRGLIKGAIRRAFARSELHRLVVEATRVEHHDPERPRVKKWSRCQKCNILTPSYQIVVDHISPIIPIDTTFEAMSLDTVVDRTWCELRNLQGIDPLCHDAKTKAENAMRPKRSRKRKAV